MQRYPPILALSLEHEEAVTILKHIWYSALLAPAMIDTLGQVALGRIAEVCEKIKYKPSTSLQAKTFLMSASFFWLPTSGV